MTLHEASAEELRDEWKRVEAVWEDMADKLDLPWVRARFVSSVFKTVVRQRHWRVPTMLGGPL